MDNKVYQMVTARIIEQMDKHAQKEAADYENGTEDTSPAQKEGTDHETGTEDTSPAPDGNKKNETGTEVQEP